MKYITKEDLIEVIQERLINESVALVNGENIEDNTIITGIENKVIEFVSSYISGRYNTDIIFSETAPVRNGVLVQIVASIVVYRTIKRNAARKLPQDIILLYNDAKSDLKRIQSGAMELSECPKTIKQDGTSSRPVYGNTTKDEYFI